MRAGRNTHGIHKHIGGSIGVVEGQAVVVGIHGKEVARIIRCDSRRSAFELVKHLIHHIALNDRFLFGQKCQCLSPFLGIVGVDTVSELELRRSKGVARVVELENVSSVIFIPKKCPFSQIFLVLRQHLGVVDDTHRAVGVGNRVFFIGIVVKPFELAIDVLIIFNILCRIDLSKQAFGSQTCHHVVRRNDHVITDRSARKLGIKVFIAGIGGVIDFYI